MDLSSLSDKDLMALYKKTESEISAFDNLQMAMKILLNSLYGGTANKGFRFFDNDVAETITLVGQYVLRSIQNNIDDQLNNLFKTVGHKYLIYIDTDSTYFDISPVVEKYIGGGDTSVIIKKMEKIAVDILQTEVNKIVANVCSKMNAYENKLNFKLEVCADKAIWLAMKKYVVRVYSSEGVTYSKPKYKIVGLELVRSSTPMFIRKKLKEVIPLVFDTNEETVQKFLLDTRKEFDKLKPEEIAFPRSANNLGQYSDPDNIYKKGGGAGTPAHVRASLLYNYLLGKGGYESSLQKITSGAKIKFLYLKLPNPLRENIIGFPADETLPPVFGLDKYIDKDLQWEKTMISATQIILQPLGWNTEPKSSLDDFFN